MSRLASYTCSESDFVTRARPFGDEWLHRAVAAAAGATGGGARPCIPWERRASSHQFGIDTDEKGGLMYVGVGTILAIVLIILLIYLLT